MTQLAKTDPKRFEEDLDLRYQRAIGALAERDYVEAEDLLRASASDMLELRLYLMCLAEREQDARDLVEQNPNRFADGFLDWLTTTHGFDPRQQA